MKLIIEIPESVYEAYKVWHKNKVATVEQSLIANSKPYEERPQGEWIKWNFKTFGAFGDWEYKCSNCEKVYGGEYNFCPNCGAQMKGYTE